MAHSRKLFGLMTRSLKTSGCSGVEMSWASKTTWISAGVWAATTSSLHASSCYLRLERKRWSKEACRVSILLRTLTMMRQITSCQSGWTYLLRMDSALRITRSKLRISFRSLMELWPTDLPTQILGRTSRPFWRISFKLSCRLTRNRQNYQR